MNIRPSMSGQLLSLFAGCGGLDLGFEGAGFRIGLALDNDPAAVKTYNHNRQQRTALRFDLSSATASDVMGLWEDGGESEGPVGVIGGPPCQAFSVSNVHLNDGDPRALLAMRYADIIGEINSRAGLDFFVFENVKGILQRKHQTVYGEIKRRFRDAGFLVFEAPLDAADFGVAQRRTRVLVIGVNAERVGDRTFEFPKPANANGLLTVRDAIGDLDEPLQFARGLNPLEFPVHPNHWCMRPKSPKFGNGTLTPGTMMGRSFRVLDWDVPSWTVAYGHREVHVHPSGRRRLSVFEAMRLQGFPDSYRLLGTMSDQIRLVSDAVPPPLARAVAGAIRSYLTEEQTAADSRLAS